jgi:hypothetical protein
MAKTYLDELMETLEPQKELAELFKKKIEELNLITINNKSLDSLEIINHKIDLIKTKSELFTLEKIIKEKEEYFKKYAIQFELDFKEADQKYKKVIEKVIKKAKTDKLIESYLKKINFEAIESNKEVKVAFYKQFKGLL